MNIKKVHFMGIGGSGISAVAALAKSQGLNVTGCDLNTNTPYLENVKKVINKIDKGHSENHLKNIDLLVTTPAVIFQNNNHPEIISKEDGYFVFGKPWGCFE
jgi:UDP-N-acetylmuramate--alanine ligase